MLYRMEDKVNSCWDKKAELVRSLGVGATPNCQITKSIRIGSSHCRLYTNYTFRGLQCQGSATNSSRVKGHIRKKESKGTTKLSVFSRPICKRVTNSTESLDTTIHHLTNGTTFFFKELRKHKKTKYAYQNYVTGQTTMSHVHIMTVILLISAQQKIFFQQHFVVLDGPIKSTLFITRLYWLQNTT